MKVTYNICKRYVNEMFTYFVWYRKEEKQNESKKIMEEGEQKE